MLQFGDPQCREVAQAGGKGASLARMTELGLPVPEGFVIPADVLAGVVDADALRAALPDHDKAQAIVAAAEVPDAVTEAYAALGDDPPVAVRSSACAEDSETASYAGQQ
jgi:pyruvate,water dikinase